MKSTSSPSNLGLISSKDAAQHAGFTHDYISRLCRFGKVKGEKIGNTWYIDKESLDEFLLKQQTKREVRKHELSEERKIEYLEPGIFISTKKKEILGVRKIPDAEASKFSSRVVKEFFTIDENVKGSISDFDFLKAKYVAVAIALLCTFGFSSFAFSESKYFALARTHALDTFAPLVVVGSYMGNVATGVFSERVNIFVDPVVSTAIVFSSTISFLTSTFDGVSSRTKLAFETVLNIFSFSTNIEEVAPVTRFEDLVKINDVNRDDSVGDVGIGGADVTVVSVTPSVPATLGGDTNVELGINTGVSIRDGIRIGGPTTLGSLLQVSGLSTFSNLIQAGGGINTNGADINTGGGR